MASKSEEKGEELLRLLPPGYRFKPNDFELVDYYLKRKVYNKPLPRNVIREVQLYNYDPETLIAEGEAEAEDEWYFFTPRDRKYRNGSRPGRAAGSGFWKATGADKRIKCRKGNLIGFKKTLVFQRGKPPHGDKTNWNMHEYVLNNPPARERISNDDMRLDDWVLCRVYKKQRGLKANPETPKQNTDQNQEEAAEVAILAHTETQKQENGIPPPPQSDHQFQVQHFSMLPQEQFYSNASDNSTFAGLPELPKSFGSLPEPDTTMFFQQAAVHSEFGMFIPAALPFSSVPPNDQFQKQQQFSGSSNDFGLPDDQQFSIDDDFLDDL
ncbi:hypothetical protein DITRI_Ditri09bG0140300 [Diplodiscus trichospermus]